MGSFCRFSVTGCEIARSMINMFGNSTTDNNLRSASTSKLKSCKQITYVALADESKVENFEACVFQTHDYNTTSLCVLEGVLTTIKLSFQHYETF